MDRRLRGGNPAVVAAVVVVLMLALMSSSGVEQRPGLVDVQTAEADALADVPQAAAASRRDILFIKVPKSGGTTLAITLSRYARRFNAKVADPGKTERTWVVDTCEGSPASRLQQVCVRLLRSLVIMGALTRAHTVENHGRAQRASFASVFIRAPPAANARARANAAAARIARVLG